MRKIEFLAVAVVSALALGDLSIAGEPAEAGSRPAVTDGRGLQFIEAYTDRHSYAPGETIRFHVSTQSPTYTVIISRVEFPWWRFDAVVATAEGIAGEYHPKPSEAWLGAGWPASFEMVVEETWVTGSYTVQFVTEDGTVHYHPFYVRPAVPGSLSKMVYIGNFNTLASYNTWGGRDFYTRPRAYKASLARPFLFGSGKGRTQWHHRMLVHLEDLGYEMEYITEWDIEQDPEILRVYDVVILAGHHEYVSTTFYDAIQDHHDRGGHLANFDADGLYWQVRFEDEGSKVVGYKEFSDEDDPLYGYVDCLVTEAWGSDLLQRPAEALRGVQRNKLYFYFEDGDYIVQNASHWIFEGTGVQNGDAFGSTMAIAEQDTITEFSGQVDILLHAHRDVVKPNRTPPDGVTAADMYAVYYADTPEYGYPDGNGGMVFTAGTITGWIRHLYQQPDTPKVERATMNILDRMLATPPPVHNGDPMRVYCVPCFADLNADGLVDTLDFLAFFNAWAAGDLIADWNGDGEINTQDFLAYLGAWAAGC
jgi:hypothetical protein